MTNEKSHDRYECVHEKCNEELIKLRSQLAIAVEALEKLLLHCSDTPPDLWSMEYELEKVIEKIRGG